MHSQCRESFVQGMQRQIAVRSAKRQISAGIAARKEERGKKESAGTLLRMKHQNSNLRIHLQSAGPARCTVRVHSTIDGIFIWKSSQL